LAEDLVPLDFQDSVMKSSTFIAHSGKESASFAILSARELGDNIGAATPEHIPQQNKLVVHITNQRKFPQRSLIFLMDHRYVSKTKARRQ
jgi:hypothetical protein